ncbi:unnamed protein product [Effrenium voratum]|nr:unnamed protein product [Effrenium voratum]|mmetsp:Transcript_118101/g.280393  ORF Transcript_118101/g.280393 Transcript_118101/m.280393 type:complete len:322 (+) Transcript_118101:43-1008(+)
MESWRLLWLLVPVFAGPVMRRDGQPAASNHSHARPSSLLQLASGVQPCGIRANQHCEEPRSKGTPRAAVYTYNLGGYEEPRGFQVPCVPPDVDAFLFLDEVTQRKAPKAALDRWKGQGWQLKLLPLQQGTRYVSSERLTSKSLKFTPPSWLTASYDWLIGYDHDMTINLHRLTDFLREHDDKPLLMLKWYWRPCEDAFDCMLWEINDMLTKRPEYVKSSRRNVQHWKELMTTLHSAAAPFSPPHYYESCIIFRNLKHERADAVKTAFERTYNMTHDIQRDQFLLPYYLWREALSPQLQALHLSDLQEKLDFCSVPTKRKRN